MRTLVMKFGGSTVGTTATLNQLASIVLTEKERWDRLVIVVSALDGITDQLIEAAHFAQLSQRRGYRRIVATLRARHLALIEHLIKPVERASLLPAIDSLLYDMLDICQTMPDKPSAVQQRSIDAIVSVGERLSARIVAALLRQINLRSVALDTTDMIITDTVHGNASPNMILTRERIATQLIPMLERGILPVLTGFIGATPAGQPTTLGRGGSDYTASIIGTCMDADEVWIWTDVDGMMSADPLDVQDARTIPILSYEEAAELASFGAHLLHPRMVGLIRERNVPVRIRNVYHPQDAGTWIRREDQGNAGPALHAVTAIPAIAWSAPDSRSLAAVSTLVDEVFFRQTGNHADVMIAAQSPYSSLACFIVPTTTSPNAVHELQLALNDRLSANYQLAGWTIETVTVVTVVGEGLGRAHALVATVMACLDGLPLLAAVFSPSQRSVSVIVDPQLAGEALHRIHRLVLARFNSASGNALLPTQ